MHSILIQLGPFTLHVFGVMMVLGFLSGFMTWLFIGRRQGRDANFCSDLLFWLLISGIVGARLASVLAEWRIYVRDPIQIFQIWNGGLIYYGGFFAAGLALLVFARRAHVRLLDLLDFVVTALPLAHALGRIGCFFTGCCFGAITRGPLSVTFPGPDASNNHLGSPAWCDHVDHRWIPFSQPRSEPVHPVQLYECALNLALYAALLLVYRRRRREGNVLAVYLLTYPVIRFMMEFLRGDPRLGAAGLNAAQWISMALFVIGLVLLVWPRRVIEPAPATTSS
jgi:phosphatidylglycerol:prolipoprotein diacylglycerol transferase